MRRGGRRGGAGGGGGVWFLHVVYNGDIWPKGLIKPGTREPETIYAIDRRNGFRCFIYNCVFKWK